MKVHIVGLSHYMYHDARFREYGLITTLQMPKINSLLFGHPIIWRILLCVFGRAVNCTVDL